ncbi:MAG: BON domain-containing protein [Burkholderiales bacterium]|nr:BON domain-containing protein [Burkholderiales bacterium]
MNHGVMKRLACSVGAAVLLTGALSACVGPLVVGGAMVGGSLVATDRRTSGAQLDDEAIELRAANQINSNLGTRVRVSVTSYNRQVLLTGEVPNLQDKQRVEQVVRTVDSVASVVNELAVLNSPSLMDRSSDALLTGRIKAMLLDTKDLQSNAFKVVTERNTTYLMGRVTQREADRATEVVRATPGVQKVVRIFEIISEQELENLHTVPSSMQTPAAPKPAGI